MSLDEVKYDAFISYRHSEKDKFVATTLHRKLETFRLPKALVQQCNGRTKIERVFRDQDELPLAANLSDPIELALEKSDYLLVICTPRLPESQWCRKEIETFSRLHGRDHILLVLAEGEPSESFPDLLMHDTVEEIDENGNVRLVDKPVEPLAADVRGASEREIKKKIDDAVLRIAAAIFGLNYDDLKQRNRERRIKKLIAIWGSIGAAVLVFAIVCASMLVVISSQKNTIEKQYDSIAEHSLEISRQNLEIIAQNEEITSKSNEISKQNEEITKKNEEITKQNEEITRQKEQLRVQYEEASEKYSISMAAASSNLMAAGKRIDALYAVRNALPDSLEDDDRVYTAAAHKALVDALAPYTSASLYIPLNSFEDSKGIEDFITTSDAKYIAVKTGENRIIVFESETGEVVCDVFSKLDIDYVTYYAFVSDEILVVSDFTSMYGINLATGEGMKIADKPATAVIGADDRFIVCPSGGKVISAYSFSDFSELWSVNTAEIIGEDLYISGADFIFAPNGKTVYMYCSTSFMGGTGVVLGLKCKDGAVSFSLVLPEISGLNITASDKMVYVALHPDVTSGVVSKVSAYDSSSGEQVWMVEGTDSFFAKTMFYSSTHDLILCGSTKRFFTLNAKDGSAVYTYNFDDSITFIDDISSGKGTNYLLIDANNGVYSLSPTIQSLFGVNIFLSTPNVVNDKALYVNGNIFLKVADELSIVRYSYKDNPDISFLGEYNNLNSVSANGIYQLSNDSKSDGYVFNIINTLTGESISIKTDAYNYMFCEEPSDSIFFYSNSSIEKYDCKTGEKLGEFYADTAKDIRICGISSNGLYFYVVSNGAGEYVLSVYSAESFEPVLEKAFSAYVSNKFMLSDDNKVIAYKDYDIDAIQIFSVDSDEPFAYFEIKKGNFNSFVLSNDGKYLIMSYKDGTSEIYDVNTQERVKTLYDLPYDMTSFVYVSSIDSYKVLTSREMILFNSELDIYLSLSDCIGYKEDSNSLVFKLNGHIFEIPMYDYDTLISKADALLEQYECSEETKIKYNIE